MKTDILTVCDQAVAATANGVYQGIILTLLVGLALRLLGRTNAATRHSIWMATLLLLPAIIVAHYCVDNRSLGPQSPGRTLRESIPPAMSDSLPTTPVTASIPQTTAEAEPVLGMVVEASETIQTDKAGPPVPWAVDTLPLMRSVPRVDSFVILPPVQMATPRAPEKNPSAVATSLRESLRSAFVRYAQPVYWNLKSGLRIPRWAGFVVLAAWLSVALTRFLLLLCRLIEIQKLKRNSVPAATELTELFGRLRAGLGLARKVSLKVSAGHRSPVVLGFFHPVVLLPSAEVLPNNAAQTEPILRHELAHVARRDDWANLIQHFIQASLFFHPGVWWISRQLGLEREIACDDQVLHGGGAPKAYALILANLASQMKRCSPRLAPGASTNKSQLQKRISMILDTKRNTSPRLARTSAGFVTSAAALLAGLAIYSGPRLVLAQTAETTPSPDTAPAAAAAPGSATASVSSASAGESIVVSQAEPPAAPASIEGDSGPRYKPDAPGNPPGPHPVIISPMPPRAPIAIVAPSPDALPRIAAVPGAMALPPAPGSSGFAYVAGGGGDDGSIEKRLERVERMVRSLMAQQHGMSSDHPMEKGQQWNWNIDEKQMAQMKEMAERQAARAQQQAKRAAEEMKRASKDMDKAMRENGERVRGAQKEGSQKQLEALRRARENLERQMERLDSQIEKLEQDQEKLQDEQERRSELQEKKAKEETAVAEAATE